METLQRVPTSYEEWLALPAQPRTEWVDGVAIVSPGARIPHQRISRRLANLLDAPLAPLLVVEATNLRLPGNRIRIPDIVVTSQSDGVFVEETPALVVEILSPSTRTEDTVRKSAEYAGIGQYWVVDPDLRALDVFGNTGGGWESLLHLDDALPSGQVTAPGGSVVEVDLAALLDEPG